MVYRRTERAEQARAATQARILRAAGKLFATQGYDATTMQQIVAEAGTSIGNAYFYFRNKDALMRALLESSFGAMFDAAEQRVQRVPQGPERVGALIAVNVTTFLVARREMLRLLVDDTRTGVVQRLGDMSVERWIRLLADAFPDRPAEQLAPIAAAIWGVNRSVVERVALGALAMENRDAVMFLVTWTLRALDVSPARIRRITGPAWRLALRHAREQESQGW